MYAYARRVMGRRRGLLAAVVYLYMPYHLADIYVRADLAEYASFVWLPLALLAFHNLARGVTARRIGLAGLTYGALLLTHNVIGLAFTPLLVLYALFRLLAERAPWPERGVRAAGALGAQLYRPEPVGAGWLRLCGPLCAALPPPVRRLGICPRSAGHGGRDVAPVGHGAPGSGPGSRHRRLVAAGQGAGVGPLFRCRDGAARFSHAAPFGAAMGAGAPGGPDPGRYGSWCPWRP